jgi:5-hydroxyisourate hydrolase
MGISTHILDTATGRPAAAVPIRLELRQPDGSWREVSAGATDDDGRLRTLTPAGPAPHGTYRIHFDTRAYLGADAFFPAVQIEFVVRDDRHHHVPLLLSPFGYSTYRGS